MAKKQVKPVALAKAQIADFKAAGLSDAKIGILSAASGAGLSLIQIITLLMQFGMNWGPEVITIAIAVITALKAGDVAGLMALVAKYGPDLKTMIEEICAMFGIAVPPGL